MKVIFISLTAVISIIHGYSVFSIDNRAQRVNGSAWKVLFSLWNRSEFSIKHITCLTCWRTSAKANVKCILWERKPNKNFKVSAFVRIDFTLLFDFLCITWSNEAANGTLWLVYTVLHKLTTIVYTNVLHKFYILIQQVSKHTHFFFLNISNKQKQNGFATYNNSAVLASTYVEFCSVVLT